VNGRSLALLFQDIGMAQIDGSREFMHDVFGIRLNDAVYRYFPRIENIQFRWGNLISERAVSILFILVLSGISEKNSP